MADQAHTHSEWLTITWFECQGNFAAIRNFRRIAELGMPEGEQDFLSGGILDTRDADKDQLGPVAVP
jgi:hypothetical protein